MSTDEGHLSIDRLADLDAGLLDADETNAGWVHVESCNDCRTTVELLAGVPALLASMDAVPVPPEVTARVVAAIEREQLARVGEADAARARDAAPARPERAGVRRRFAARLGAGLLGATAVLGGGYLVLSGVPSGGDEDSPSISEGQSESDRLGSPDDAPAAMDMGGGEFPYSSASLDDEVRALVASAPREESARTPSVTVQGEDGEPGEPDDVAVKACVDATERRAGSPGAPLAVDVGTYDGEPAVVIVFSDGPSAAAASSLDVWVVSSSCLDGAPNYALTSDPVDVLRRETVSLPR